MTKRVYVTVEVVVDSDVRVSDVNDYVIDSVKSMGGCLDPESPFFGDNKSVSLIRGSIRNPYEKLSFRK